MGGPIIYETHMSDSDKVPIHDINNRMNIDWKLSEMGYEYSLKHVGVGYHIMPFGKTIHSIWYHVRSGYIYI